MRSSNDNTVLLLLLKTAKNISCLTKTAGKERRQVLVDLKKEVKERKEN